MQFCISVEDFSSVENNKIIGIPEKMNNSKVEFHGENNIIFFDKGVKLDGSTIRFLADNSVVFIGSSGSHKTKLKVDL